MKQKLKYSKQKNVDLHSVGTQRKDKKIYNFLCSCGCHIDLKYGSKMEYRKFSWNG